MSGSHDNKLANMFTGTTSVFKLQREKTVSLNYVSHRQT